VSDASTVTRHTVSGLAVVYRHAVTRSEAPPLLFVHGAMDRAASFGRVMRRITDRDSIAIDRRGYAESAGAGSSNSLADHAEDLRAVLDWLGRPTVVLGHSLGGTISVLLAALGDERLVAVGTYEAPFPQLDASHARIGGGALEIGRQEGPAAAAEHFYRRMVGDRTWTRLPERTRQQRCAEGPALMAELEHLRSPAPLFDPADIAVPLTAGVGASSSGSLRSGSEALVARVEGSEFLELREAGHGAHLTHPGEFAGFAASTAATGSC
jgi:pimeloyl-ACP methyl ester carboxylesterase